MTLSPWVARLWIDEENCLELLRDWTWQVHLGDDMEPLLPTLNAQAQKAHEDYSPAYGFPGTKYAYEIGKQLSARVEIALIPPAPPGIKY